MKTPAQPASSFNAPPVNGIESGAVSTVGFGLVAFFAGAWFLAQHDAAVGHAIDDLSFFQLTFKSWFFKYWMLNSAKMFLPAALGFALGWRSHRRVGSAVGGALAGAAVVAFALWQGVDELEVRKPAAQAVVQQAPKVAAASSAPAQPKPAEPAAEEKPEAEAATAKTLKPNAADETPRARSQVSIELELAEQESQRQARKHATKPAEDPLAILGKRVQPTPALQNTLGPPSGPGVMPSPPTTIAEKETDHPSFPGCKWESSTRWVCDRKP